MHQTHSVHIANVFLRLTTHLYTALLRSCRYLSSSSYQRPMRPLSPQIVLSVRHWTNTLFSFTCTRDPSFSFDSGQFAVVGLEIDGRPLMRAYGIASANCGQDLEFLSVGVPDGPLTSRLQHLQVGDPVLVSHQPVGALILDNLLPGRTLWLLAVGTGIAPFMSIIRDPAVYGRFERVVLAHSCRHVRELAYRDYIMVELAKHPRLGEQVRKKLIYYPTVTRDPFPNTGRVTGLIETGRLFTELHLDPFVPERDRLLLCGSARMLNELHTLLQKRGFDEGRQARPGHYVAEPAFLPYL